MNRVICLILLFFSIFYQQLIGCKALNILKNLYIKQDQKLPKIICDAVRDTIRKDREVSTVSMAIFEHNFDSSLVDKTLKCIPKRFSVTVKDFRTKQHKPELNGSKASIVIMIADQIDMVR